MLSKLREHVASNAVAYLALFVALGGTSYAAIRLPAGSVGTVQLKNSAVTSAKVRDGSLRSADFAAGQIGVRGPRGPAGPSGGSAAFSSTLPSGQTLRGHWEASGVNEDGQADDLGPGPISFGLQLPSAPPRTIVMSQPGPPQCPGTADAPEARPGNLCIYVEAQLNVRLIETIVGTVPGATSRQGASIFTAIANPTNGGYGARGTWAVTAP